MVNGILIRFVNKETTNIKFCIDKISTSFTFEHKVNESELRKLEKWLESESTSIAVRCEKEGTIYLNKYNIEYAMASEEK